MENTLKAISAVTLFLVLASAITFAKPPVELNEYFAISDLKMELEAKIEMLTPLLETEESFKKEVEKKIGESVVVIVCIGQALAEHPQKDELPISGVSLRVAAQKLRNAENWKEATAAFKLVKKAATEKVDSDEEVEQNWGELIDMDAMMQEMNTRRSKLRRAIKKLRKPEKDSLNAVALSLLTVAMHEDLSYAEDESSEKKWQAYSKEMLDHLKKLAKVMKAGDKKESKKVFKMVHASCNKCHDDFKDE